MERASNDIPKASKEASCLFHYNISTIFHYFQVSSIPFPVIVFVVSDLFAEVIVFVVVFVVVID